VKKLPYAFIAVLILLAVGEIAARFILGLGDPPLSVTDPKIEYMFKPNQDCQRFGNRIVINQWGMRNFEIPAEKQDKTEVRILVIGDSVINGGNLTDHDSLATTLLQNRLNKEWNRPVTVMNVSAGSWGPANMLAYVEKYGDFDADFVVIVLSSHDSQDYPEFKPLDPNTHPTKKPISALLEGVTRYLPRYLPSFLKFSENEKVERVIPIEYARKSLQAFVRLQDYFEEKSILVYHHWEYEEIKNNTAKDGMSLIKNHTIPGTRFITDSASIQAMLSSKLTPYRDNIHMNNIGQKVFAEDLYGIISNHFSAIQKPALEDAL